jgi:hypothetical protein
MYNFFFILIITIIVGYIFGLSLLNIIDKKLNNINIDIKYPEHNIETFKSTVTKKEDIKKEIINTQTYNFTTGEKINNKTNFDNEYYQQMNDNNRVEGFSNMPNDLFKKWNIEKKQTQTCTKNHIHIKDGKNLNCTYGLTNYADPYDMSPMDIKIFQLNYPPNMTLQDYINWLYCYVDKEEELPYNHLKNLEKLKMGKELIAEDGILPPPGYYYPSLNAEDYFNKMYNNLQEFNIAGPLNSVTNAMLGYNYNEYSEFSQNMDLAGSSGTLRNKDIGLKKNAKKLYDYINPRDSNSLNINEENEIYRIKNIEV